MYRYDKVKTKRQTKLVFIWKLCLQFTLFKIRPLFYFSNQILKRQNIFHAITFIHMKPLCFTCICSYKYRNKYMYMYLYYKKTNTYRYAFIRMLCPHSFKLKLFVLHVYKAVFVAVWILNVKRKQRMFSSFYRQLLFTIFDHY